MIFDSEALFSDDQAITASAASTNYMDLGAPGTPVGGAAALTRDIGPGNPIPIVVQVTEKFLTLTSLKVAVQVDDNTSFGSATTVLESEAIVLASLLVGYTFALNWIPHKTNERYLRLYYTVGGSSATAGKVTAGITGGHQTNV